MVSYDNLKKLITLMGQNAVLLFSFKPHLRGLDYVVLENGCEKIFLTSDLTVRDRKKLATSETWNKFKRYFFEGLFFVRLDGCVYICSPDVWSPSVDAAILMEVLHENVHLFNDCKSLLDLGYGTGVTTIGTSQILKSINKVFLYDVNPDAQYICAINHYLNNFNAETIFLNKNGLTSAKADICITAPYYVPIEKDINVSPEADLNVAVKTTAQMINYCIEHCQKFALFILSSITEKEVVPLIPYQFKVIKEQKVLFTIGDNVGNQGVVHSLIEKNSLELFDGDYYHIVKIGLFTR